MNTSDIRPEFLQAQRDGIAALQHIAERFEAPDWAKATGCAGWIALDLAGHLVCVADLWHDVLDRAEAGDAVPVFAWDEFDTWNAQSLESLQPGTGADRIARFVARAHDFVERMRGRGDLPFGTPGATISAVPMTVAVFAGAAPAEWHLHAWDLAVARGETYRPENPEVILDGLRVWLGLPVVAGDPWSLVLQGSGRGE